MTSVFEEASAESRAEGWAWRARFTFREMTGVIAGAAGAWFDRRRAPRASVADVARSTLPQELVDAQQRVDANIAAMVHAIANHQFERARVHSDQERYARENLCLLREKYGVGN
jgi:hypothetical protein